MTEKTTPRKKRLAELLKNPRVTGQKNADTLHRGFPEIPIDHQYRNRTKKAVATDSSENWRQNIWRRQMTEKGIMTQRTVYIHIPFCRFQCVYCPFFKNFADRSAVDHYVDDLLNDIRLCGSMAYMHSRPIKAVYFGGGTPGVLGAGQIKQIMLALKETIPFANDCEITFESSVSDLDDEQVAACLAAGVNRFSLGVQTFDTQTRRALGRPADGAKVADRLVQLVKGQKQAAVVIDLLYGLPGQTETMWCNDLELARSLGVHGLDTYRLKVFPRLADAVSKGRVKSLPDRATQADLFARAVDALSREGFRRLSICHWGKFGGRERNIYNSLTKGYSGRIPFGAGAGGNIEGYRIMLESDIGRYGNLISRRMKPIQVVAPPPTYDRETCQLQACMDKGLLNYDDMKLADGTPLAEIFEPLMKVWEARGFINRAREINELTLAGQFWSEELLQGLLEYWRAALGESDAYI